VRIAVIDSSPLINLAHLDLAMKLSQFFDVVWVPNAVQREVRKKHRFGHRLNKFYQSGFFAKCVAADWTNVQLLRAEPLGEGESEALTQAQEKAPAFFIADEKRSREIAGRMGQMHAGTARILARLNYEGLAPDLEALIRKLERDLRFRISKDVVREAISIAPQPIWPALA
jgi:predicted nucleic acid-binding protein